jgi:transposase-like protein
VRSLAEEEEKSLTFYDFSQTLHRSIRTTNAIESLWSLVRQRDLPDRCVHALR